MKVNVFSSTSNLLEDYINVNIAYIEEACEKHIDDAECEEILLFDCIEYIDFPDVDKVFNMILNKLSRGGKLKVKCKNPDNLFNKYLNGFLSVEQMNIAIFGHQNESNLFKKHFIPMERLVQYLSRAGLIITEKTLIGYDTYIVAERP